MKKLSVTILFTVLYLNSFSQIKLNGLGGYLGIGSIKGNSPSVTSFTSDIFVDINSWFSEGLFFRINFFYARKVESLLPQRGVGRYYPFQKGFSIKAFLSQQLSQYIFLEEGIGPLVLNDRTFVDTNEWTYGAAFNFLVGLNLKDKNNSGFTLGIGTEVGTAFTKTTPSYFSTHLQAAYYFGD